LERIDCWGLEKHSSKLLNCKHGNLASLIMHPNIRGVPKSWVGEVEEIANWIG
jgi:hypothetical protein